MNRSLLATQTGHSHLRRLLWLRSIAIAAQCITLALVHQFLSAQMPWLPMLITIGLLVLLNVFTLWRLNLDVPVSNGELFLQLNADVFALTALLYFGGGSTNPFVSLYLLPLVIAAATLSRRLTWAMAALTVACYSLLMVWYVPLPMGHEHPALHSEIAASVVAPEVSEHEHHHVSSPTPISSPTLPLHGGGNNPQPEFSRPSPQSDAFNTHILGMWLGFVMSAMVIAYFVVEMARAVRSRDAQLRTAREETLRNERIVALGTQAASAAHELGTPLSTLSVLIGEMQHGAQGAEQANWRILDEQVRACKRILNSLLHNAQEHASTLPLDEVIRNLLDEWQLLRPEVRCTYQANGLQAAPLLAIDPSLRAALLNLLNNAADASPHKIEIFSTWDAQQFRFEIRDYGQGLTPEAASRAGSAFFTTKREGRGLGLFLANATIERMGGSVRLFNRDEGGATTEIVLPVETLNLVPSAMKGEG